MSSQLNLQSWALSHQLDSNTSQLSPSTLPIPSCPCFCLPLTHPGPSLRDYFLQNLIGGHQPLGEGRSMPWPSPPSSLLAEFCFLSTLSAGRLLSRVWLFVTPWTVARQASLSFTISWSLLKLMSIKAVTPSNPLILCHPLLLPPSIFSSIRVFSKRFYPAEVHSGLDSVSPLPIKPSSAIRETF